MVPYAIVTINWNAARDTIECLESIFLSEPNAIAIVVDNGSVDGSRGAIRHWTESSGVALVECGTGELGKLSGLNEPLPRVVLVCAGENLGFAKGANIGLRAAQALKLEEVVFLNNDTVVGRHALSRLISSLRENSDIFAVVPLITVHGSNKIWNCGGTISKLGYRRYYYAGAIIEDVDLPKVLDCTFFTGCCFAVRTLQFMSRGGFTERFFFGEEDFDLCLWMLDHNKRAVVLTEAIVEHKVSSSFKRAGQHVSSRVYIYYLNRLIHMRLRLGFILWLLWLLLYLPYIFQLIPRTTGARLTDLPSFAWRLVADSIRHNEVDRDKFMSVMGLQGR